MPRQSAFNAKVTPATTLRELEVLVAATKHPMTNDPAVFPPHLASLCVGLGQVADACARRFVASGDRARTEIQIGQALLLLTQVAQANGTTLANAIESFRSHKRSQQPPPQPAAPATQSAA